jgi:chromosomal replication initiator protein
MRHALLVGDLNEVLAVWEKPDSLIIEEYQRFAGGPFVDQMLVQLLELRREAGRLTIFVGQQAPWLGCKFSSRMQSRLSHGLSLEVHQAGELALRKIAEWTAQSLGLHWEPEALDSAAKSNLSATGLMQFMRRFAESADGPRSIGENAVQELLAQSQQVQPIEPRLVLGLVARYFRLKLADLVGPSRRQSLVKARGIAICLLRDLCGLKWQTIAEIIGRKDHSTVLHAYAKTLESLEQDQLLAEAFRQVRQKLNERQLTECRLSKSR